MKTTVLYLLVVASVGAVSAEAFAAPSSTANTHPHRAGGWTKTLDASHHHHHHRHHHGPRRKSTTTEAASLDFEAPKIELAVILPPPNKEVAVVPAEQTKESWFKSIDGIVYCSYLCNVMALSLPVLLVPIAATEHVVALGSGSGQLLHRVAATVAGITSVATLGGATGKFTNGFICQAVGSYASSKVYFVGLAACSFLFSLASTPTAMGLAYAGMEFFASIQWAALAVMLSNYYSSAAPLKLAAALTALGLSSTSGQIAAKTLGAALASSLHWRVVAQIGAAMALAGGLIISRAPKPQPDDDVSRSSAPSAPPPLSLQSIARSLRAVLGSKLFWMLALAHSMAFVARGTDRILGTFFQSMAGDAIPQALAGGLTLSITLGLVHGLVTGSKQFTALSQADNNVTSKKRFLAKRYAASVAAALGLTATAQYGPALIPSKFLLTALIGLLSGCMASNVAFQYFQFPAMIAKSQFADHKAIVISFLDGFGFLFSAPIFALTGKLVPALGWSSAWGMLAALFGAGAALMLYSIQPVLEKSDLKI